ncbi:MAG: DUF1465 family protein [Holosporales bacterium]
MVIRKNTFFDPLFSECMDLLDRTWKYSQYHIHRDTQALQPETILRLHCEMTRITARLTQVMAWLLAQKAAIEGEITYADANSSQYQLSRDAVCLEDNGLFNRKQLPGTVCDLLDQTLKLYMRVARLADRRRRPRQHKNVS